MIGLGSWSRPSDTARGVDRAVAGGVAAGISGVWGIGGETRAANGGLGPAVRPVGARTPLECSGFSGGPKVGRAFAAYSALQASDRWLPASWQAKGFESQKPSDCVKSADYPADDSPGISLQRRAVRQGGLLTLLLASTRLPSSRTGRAERRSSDQERHRSHDRRAARTAAAPNQGAGAEDIRRPHRSTGSRGPDRIAKFRRVSDQKTGCPSGPESSHWRVCAGFGQERGDVQAGQGDGGPGAGARPGRIPSGRREICPSSTRECDQNGKPFERWANRWRIGRLRGLGGLGAPFLGNRHRGNGLSFATSTAVETVARERRNGPWIPGRNQSNAARTGSWRRGS